MALDPRLEGRRRGGEAQVTGDETPGHVGGTNRCSRFSPSTRVECLDGTPKVLYSMAFVNCRSSTEQVSQDTRFTRLVPEGSPDTSRDPTSSTLLKHLPFHQEPDPGPISTIIYCITYCCYCNSFIEGGHERYTVRNMP